MISRNDRSTAILIANKKPNNYCSLLWYIDTFKSYLSETNINPGFLTKSKDLWFRKNKFCLIEKLIFSISAILGLSAVIIYIIKVSPPKKSLGKVKHNNLLCALHPEISGRTRHILSLIKSDIINPQSLIILGRSTLTKKEILESWNSYLIDKKLELIRPYDWCSVIRSIPSAWLLYVNGLRNYSSLLFLLPAREKVAICFRVFLGNISFKWLKSQNLTPQSVVLFGITGTADTVSLELAIHYKNSYSIHCVHGQSSGLNFLSYSDVAIFQSEYDASYYRRINSYRKCISFPTSIPKVQSRLSDKIILFSNLAHPSNPYYQRHGSRDELYLLSMVAKILSLKNFFNFNLVWKPHPILYKLHQSQRLNLFSYAKSLGFRIAAQDSSLVDLTHGSKWVLTSPSTIAIDCLKIGILPIIIDLQKTVLDSSLCNFPRIKDFAELIATLEHLELDNNYAESFEFSWSQVLPSASYDLEDISQNLE
ncbi:hypothetical protein [Synechococcus elongatus]|uniref:hypothetical protein n=1 Tax=Synechococcus elongatus TaxID=32046 RepID=UPI0030CC2446